MSAHVYAHDSRPQSVVPPRFKQDLDAATTRHGAGFELSPHMSDLERLLVLTPGAPAILDVLPMLSKSGCSKLVVEVLKDSVRSNDALGPLVKRVGQALGADRASRLVAEGQEPNFSAGVEVIQRTQVVPPRSGWQPRY